VDTMTVNKIVAGVLIALLLAKGASILAEGPFHVEAPDEPAYAVAMPESDGDAAAEEPEEPEAPSLAMLLQDASAESGARQFRKCSACHGVEAGGPHKIGPNLHDVVGAPVGGKDGFSYSSALASHGGEWTYDLLDAWLAKPGDAIPGNKMAFAGISDPEDRADLIAYLRDNSENPPALPEPETASAE